MPFSGAAGLLLEDMGHKEARGVAHRWRLVDLFMPPGQILPAGSDQVDAKGIDQVLADLGGGGHGSGEIHVELAEQLRAVVDQNWQIRLDGTPDHLNTHIQILVGEQVAEVDDLSPFWDRRE